jgi:hypothetical protein
MKATKSSGVMTKLSNSKMNKYSSHSYSNSFLASLIDKLQSWTFRIIPKTATINALVTLSLDPETVHSDFIRVKYHKDQANDKDYSHEGLGFTFKKW